MKTRAPRLLPFVVLCVLTPLIAHGQTVLPLSKITTGPGGESSWAQRLTPARSTLRTLLLGVTLTAWSSRYDEKARAEFSSAGWWETDLIDAGDADGHGICLVGLTAATWGIGAVVGDATARGTGEKMALGLVVDAALVNSLKLISRRTRPDGSDMRSFPSGHTSGAFTLSTILSRRHGWRIGLPAFALASLTALARMEDSKHYASDVIAGAFLGLVVSRLVTPSGGDIAHRLQLVSGPLLTGLQFSF